MLRNRIKKNSLLWVLRKTKKRMPAIASMAAMSMVSAYLSVRFTLGTQQVIDAAVAKDLAWFQHAAIYLGVLILFVLGLNLLQAHTNDKLDADLDRDMKQSLMQMILRGDYQVIAQYHSGDLVHRMNTDVSTVNSSLVELFTGLCSFVVQMAAVFVVLLRISPVFTFAMLGFSLVLGGGTLLFQRMLKDLHTRINTASGRISGFLQEVIEKILIVQALDVGDTMEEKTEALLEERWQLQRKRKNLSLMSTAGMSVLGEGIGFITLIWCTYRLLHGTMSFGTLTATTRLASQLQAPIMVVPYFLRRLIVMSASAERLMEIEEIPQEKKDTSLDLSAVYDKMESIRAQELCFSYDRELVLDHLSFEIPKGGLTVIVGQSGSGKSTLLRLLLSVLKPLEGSLDVKMKDGSVLPVSRNLRRLFTYAPQGNLLMSGTLRDNLLLARPDATDAEIEEAVYISAISDYLPQLPEGLDTMLGENGVGLSEGQAQRVALARAILSGAPILLLDEVTSSLDGETERKVLERIRGMKDKTCIVVTHRPAILALADETLSIVDGRMERYTRE